MMGARGEKGGEGATHAGLGPQLCCTNPTTIASIVLDIQHLGCIAYEDTMSSGLSG